MFQAERWATAFTELCGKDLDEGMEAFNTFVSSTAGVRSHFSGNYESLRFEALLREALRKTGFDPGILAGKTDLSRWARLENRGTELALRFIVLLVRKDYFKYRLAVLKEIEKAADRMKGILRVILESAAPIEAELEEKLKAELMRKTGAQKIVVYKRIVPELIAGYRVYIGTELLDTSLQGSMRKMAVGLGVPVSGRTDGDFIDSMWESD
jgi:F-type H+-transporting ATPase subunit delta